MHAIHSLKVIIVVTKNISCYTSHTYMVTASLHARGSSCNGYIGNQHSWKTPQNQQTSLILTIIHLSSYISYCSKGILFSDFCVMNMVHTCDSNKFMQWKRGGYYIIVTVLSYIKLFLMFPGINLLLLLCIIAGSSRKLVKIGGSSETLVPPWLWA